MNSTRGTRSESGRSAWAAATAATAAQSSAEKKSSPDEPYTTSPTEERSAVPKHPVLPKCVPALAAEEKPRSMSSDLRAYAANLPSPPAIPLHLQKPPSSRGSLGNDTPPPLSLATRLSKDVRSMTAGDVNTVSRWVRVAPGEPSVVRRALLSSPAERPTPAVPQQAHPMAEKFLKLSAMGSVSKIREMLRMKVLDFEKCTDKDGNTAGHVAARYGKLDVLQMLADEHCEIGKPSAVGNTSLHYAAAKGHVDVVRWLIEELIVQVDAVNDNGASALHLAAESGQPKTMELLLKAGADANRRSRLGSTPMMSAAEKGHLVCVEILLASGATHKGRNTDGMTALHRAARGGHVDVFRRLFVLSGASVADANALGNTFLHLAAAEGRVAMAETLLTEYKAPVDATNQDGWTALHYAADGGHLRMVQALLKARAHSSAVTSYGSTALHWASEGGHLEVANALLTTGDVNLAVLDKTEASPVHLAAEAGFHKLVLVYVKEYGAKLDDRAKKAMLSTQEKPLPTPPP